MRLTAFALALVSPIALSAPFLMWDAPTTDVQGNPIAEDMTIRYEVYIRNGGSTEPRVLFGSTDGELFLDLAGAPTGCIDYAAVAIRTDTSPELISALSEPFLACDFDFIEPGPPTNVRVGILPPA